MITRSDRPKSDCASKLPELDACEFTFSTELHTPLELAYAKTLAGTQEILGLLPAGAPVILPGSRTGVYAKKLLSPEAVPPCFPGVKRGPKGIYQKPERDKAWEKRFTYPPYHPSPYPFSTGSPAYTAPKLDWRYGLAPSLRKKCGEEVDRRMRAYIFRHTRPQNYRELWDYLERDAGEAVYNEIQRRKLLRELCGCPNLRWPPLL